MKNLPEWLKLLKGDLDTEDGEATMLLQEPIGYNPMTGDGISARRFVDTLSSIPKTKTVHLHINTLGGSIPEGIAMHNAVLSRGNVHTCVTGYAASMGAIIHQAGVKRSMMPGTMLVIHNPQTESEGDEHDVEQQLNMLRQAKTNLVNLLHNRTGLDPDKLSDMMDKTTAMTPEEAKKLGFCDEVIEGSPAWNSFDPAKFFNSCRKLTGTAHVPAAGGGKSATVKQTNSMKLTEALAKLKLIPSADMSEDAAAAHLEQSVAAIQQENASLKTAVETHTNALRLRVTNRVDKAIADKLALPEAKETLIGIGMTNEVGLEAVLGRPVATTETRRAGSPPLPAEGKDAGESNEDKAAKLRNEMKTMTPEEKGRAARQLRALRGHSNLFKDMTTTEVKAN